MAGNENLFNIIEELDSSEPLVAGYSSANLANVVKALNSENKQELEQSKTKIPTKVKNLVKLVNKVVEGINANLVSKYPEMKPFNLEKNVTYNAFGATGKFELIQAGNSQHLSFNVKKLTRLPGLEIAAVITKAVVDAIAKENGKENDNDFVAGILSTEKSDNEKKNEKHETDVEKAKIIVAAYLRKYLPAIYSDDFKKFDNISSYVANVIVSEMGESDLNKILSPFFDLDTLDISKLAVNEVDAFLGKTGQARYLKIAGKAEDYLLDSENEVLALGYEQQAQALLGTDTSDPEYYDLSKKFETLNNGEKCLTGPAVQEFCEYYVHNFLHAHNMKDIKVTFDPKGALGSYYDGGVNQRININLQKLKKIGSYTELAMTISHELTHAVDATRNRTSNVVGLEDESGLINDIDEDISGSGATGEVKELLVELKSFCYHINPNEKHARIGELSALLFMQKVGSKDPKIQAEISNSIAKYKRYQQKTIDMIKSLPVKISEFKDRRDILLSNGELSENSIAWRMIKERIEYLENNGLENKKEPVSIQSEQDSIMAADMIEKGDLEGLARLQAQQVQKEEAERAAQEAAKKAQEEEEQFQRE